MLNIHVEMPLGNKSRGFDREDAAEADKIFDQMVAQIKKWKNFVADVVMRDEQHEIRREHIEC